MRISTIGYSMKQGVKNIGRNKMFSIASIATMAACIFLFGLFFSIVINFNYIVEKAEEGVAITVFFEEEATQEQKDAIGSALESADGVLEIRYVSAEEAWEKFQKDYFGDTPDKIFSNVLATPAAETDIAAFATLINNNPGLERVFINWGILNSDFTFSDLKKVPFE